MKQEVSLSAERYNSQLLRRILLAMLMGVLTVFFCLYVADGVFGMQGLKRTEFLGDSIWYGPVTEKSVDRDNQTGAIIFWLFAIGISLVFSLWIRWCDTLINYLFYPICWLVVDEIVGSHPGHYFLYHGHMSFGFERVLFLLYWSLCIFVIQGFVFAFVSAFRKLKNT